MNEWATMMGLDGLLFEWNIVFMDFCQFSDIIKYFLVIYYYCMSHTITRTHFIRECFTIIIIIIIRTDTHSSDTLFIP